MTERLNKTEFFEKYGHKLKPVRFDDPETGDYLIWSPEEDDKAEEYYLLGYDIVTVYEPAADGEDDIVELDYNKGSNPYKVGYLVLTNQ
jgi:hypothetical protein